MTANVKRLAHHSPNPGFKDRNRSLSFGNNFIEKNAWE
jgi:hypothetical protein